MTTQRAKRKQPVKRKRAPAATPHDRAVVARLLTAWDEHRCVVCGGDLECPTCSMLDPHLAAQLDAALPDLTDWEVADLRALIEREIERRGPAVGAGLRPALPVA